MASTTASSRGKDFSTCTIVATLLILACSFPLVYIEMYHFNLGQMGLTFLSITVGVIIAMIMYWSYIYWVVEPDLIKNGLGAPEKRLVPALFASFLLPIGLFIFGT
jgi:DHA1 family multidrug resistance protein-like MFS transporter